MFASRMQVSQVFMGLSFLLTLIMALTALFGPALIAITCLVLAHGCAATGCYIHAEVKGYPPLIGLPIGVIFGVFGAVVMIILPDESRHSTHETDREMAAEAFRNARRRDPGYEVLDDEDD
jgi:uncharacterized membrane protein YgaE (UPF0421/DUF939 family)